MSFINSFFKRALSTQYAVQNEQAWCDKMYFLECTEGSSKNISGTYIRYEFTQDLDEYDARIVRLSEEIIKRFCGSRQVLTRIYSDREFSKKEARNSKHLLFTVRYREFLESMDSTISMYAENERTLFLLTDGFDGTALWANQKIDTENRCYFDFYVLPENSATFTAKETAEAVAAGNYDVWFQICENGASALYVTLNPETVDVGELQELIAAVCEENNILFQNPKEYEG
ncbi:hypothetical protein [Oscillibacter sp.]|uniref:hypothetical protein n=1 Tax=Oscillibacter sp. TaxID=1945593 RepID=UPI002897D3DF|nr:hypothetical protein [Oscillibacter sp.]